MLALKPPSPRVTNILACLLLALLVLAVYGQSRNFEFVSFDDGIYIYNNARVKAGLSEGWLSWCMSFEAKNKTYWHPLTWFSHMLDCELFGLNAGAHHLTNVVWHFLNACLLFLTLQCMTGSSGGSLLAAALFAVHPVNAESVAWVAERKNVLSTTFWLLTTWLYVAYARKPDMKRYALMLLAFTLGLLAKPMLVTLPCTLLLLDFWPLRRLKLGAAGDSGGEGSGWDKGKRLWAKNGELILEKLPLLFLSLLATYLAMGSVRQTDLKIPFEAIPLGLRIENLLVTFVTYLSKALWPSSLAMFYPYPESLALLEVYLSAAVLAAVTIAAVAMLKKRPYFLVGWLWFLGTLFPVSGIVIVGLWPAWADRWAYIPYIGLFIALVWGLKELTGRAGVKARGLGVVLALATLGALTFAGHRQASVWKDGLALYQNAVDNVEGNYLAHNNLGVALSVDGRMDEALYHYREALRINPLFPFPYFNLGRYFIQQGDFARAQENCAEALSINPDYSAANMCMGEALLKQGDTEKALFHYKAAQKIEPYEKKIYNDIGVLFLQTGQTGDAIHSFKAALRLDPGFTEAHNNIGFAYLRSGQINLAKSHLEKALALEPGNVLARENLDEALSAGRPN